MTKNVRILSKRNLPIWLVVLALVVAGAGAAAGTVLAGKVTGEVPVAVSQALLVEYPRWISSAAPDPGMPQQVERHATWIHAPNRGVGVASDDNTAFQAAAELAVGDWAAFLLPLKNASMNALTGELTFNVPECLEVEVYVPAAPQLPAVAPSHLGANSIVRTGLNTWKILVPGNTTAEYLDPGQEAYVIVVISIDDTCQPGYFNIDGTFKQIAY